MIYQNFSKRQNLTLTWWNRPKFKDCDGIICDGAIRSGKTVAMSVGFILWAMSNFNGYNFAICGKTIESLRRNVITLLPQWLEGIFTATERRSENKLIVTDGTVTNTFYLFGGKDESSCRLVQGITLAGVLFDEVAIMPRSFVEQTMARCSVDGSKFWFNCNPENPGHWFYVEWIKKAHERNILYLHFTMADNLSLSEKIKARYESMYNGVFYRRYILGLWVRAEGLVYPMFNRDAHVVRKFPEKSLRHRYYLSVDYGTVNPFAAGLWDYSPAEQKATMIRELYYKGGSADRVDNEAYYKMLCELAEGYDIEYIIIDPSAASMVETIQKYGTYMVVRADNDVLNGIQDVTKFLNAGCLAFHYSCKNTFEEFEAYSWDESKVEDTVIKENDHCLIGDTLVDTVDGQTRIDELVGKEGYVYCTDGKSKQIGRFHGVRMTQENAEVYKITLQDGRTVTATAEHPILTERGWVMLKDLRMDDKIACIAYADNNRDKILKNLQKNAIPKASEWHKSEKGKEWHREHWQESIGKVEKKEHVCQYCGIAKIEKRGTRPVYNMEVDEYHNFSVNDGIIVHNCMDQIRYYCRTMLRNELKWIV